MASSFSLGFDDLACFVRVAEQGSFTRAAHVLGVRKATVSRHIQQLEARLGVQLLVRSTRAVHLTDEGRVYLASARAAVTAADDAARAVTHSRHTPSGILRIATVPYLGDVVLGPLLIEYLRRYPKTSIFVSMSLERVDIVSGGFDISLHFGKLTGGDFVARRLASGGMGCYASPVYVAKAGTPKAPRDLVKHETIALGGSATAKVSWRFHRPTQRQTVVLHPRLVSPSPELAAQAACAGLGIARFPKIVARPLLAKGLLLRVLADWDGAAAPLYLLMPRQRQLPQRTRAFVDMMAEAAAAGHLTRQLAGEDG